MNNPVIDYINDLVKRYNYKKLPPVESSSAIAYYAGRIPQDLDIKGSEDIIYSESGIRISDGYDRIVIGDYGAFIEFSPDQANHNKFVYTELNTPCMMLFSTQLNDCKMYLQTQRVDYADYIPGKFYVSVYEVTTVPF